MLGATAAALVLAPLAVPAAAAFDLARGRRRLPTARTYRFVARYLVNDSAEILAAGPLWLLAGFGTRLGGAASQRRHRRLQTWSLRTLAVRAERDLGLRLELEPGAERALVPGPAIVVCRHVSLFDASIPGLLYDRLGVQARGVIMAELLADPGFDLLYQRVGSVFIARDDDPSAAAEAASIGTGLDGRGVAVIFPEGRLFRPEVRDRALARLAERDPGRAARLAGLRHLLPPRPGGFFALLDAAPGADVVVVNHAGLDRHPRLADIARRAPLADPITVGVRRVARADIPDDRSERLVWLDEVWTEMDAWVAARLAPGSVRDDSNRLGKAET
ncbi:MAG: 1-acyl-sn-glycerol-3-phosphate acyltransferase [Acidimicrobiia bacterium]|nr:1-acyl-sn-glycerol-3-phosphate acyltransferase [Acidimicrobiia bacterium]